MHAAAGLMCCVTAGWLLAADPSVLVLILFASGAAHLRTAFGE